MRTVSLIKRLRTLQGRYARAVAQHRERNTIAKQMQDIMLVLLKRDNRHAGN